MRRRAVLLDALGTLVNLEPPAPRLRRVLLERFGLSVSEDEARRAMAAEITYYREHLDEARDEQALRELRRRCAEVMWGALPGAPRSADADAVVEALLASLQFTAFADVPDGLRGLRKLGLRLVVVSNWDISLAGVLDRLDLTRWLDGVVTSAGVGARKPDPEIFVRALALAEAEPDEALHVGDTLEEDVAGARAAGIEPVWMVRSDGARQGRGVPVISSLAELPGLLAG